MKKWQYKLHEIIYEADTKSGKRFDIWLLIFILLSVTVVMLDSVESIRVKYKNELFILEWIFTIIFTIEYILRIISIKKPLKYVFSFYGIIDFLSILPTFLGLFTHSLGYLRVIRSLRLLRLFKILKMHQFSGESTRLWQALKASRIKISVFLFAVLAIVMIMGTIMYMIEGGENGFTSIPRSMYWAIVTLTTVGYGDISPVTPLGQFIASVIMILGYGIIAVPTGIVTSELSKESNRNTDIIKNTISCSSCSLEGHADDAKHCKFCGELLHKSKE